MPITLNRLDSKGPQNWQGQVLFREGFGRAWDDSIAILSKGSNDDRPSDRGETLPGYLSSVSKTPANEVRK
jgi:hypothetical protein